MVHCPYSSIHCSMERYSFKLWCLRYLEIIPFLQKFKSSLRVKILFSFTYPIGDHRTCVMSSSMYKQDSFGVFPNSLRNGGSRHALPFNTKSITQVNLICAIKYDQLLFEEVVSLVGKKFYPSEYIILAIVSVWWIINECDFSGLCWEKDSPKCMIDGEQISGTPINVTPPVRRK